MEVRVKKILTVLVSYVAGFGPIAALLWLGWRRQSVVRLALPGECPKGSEPIVCAADGTFIIFGIARDGVHRYIVHEIEFNSEAVTGKERATPARVVFSGCLATCSYRKAEILVRGTLEDLDLWRLRVEALKAA